jgi:hypothetical protein
VRGCRLTTFKSSTPSLAFCRRVTKRVVSNPRDFSYLLCWLSAILERSSLKFSKRQAVSYHKLSSSRPPPSKLPQQLANANTPSLPATPAPRQTSRQLAETPLRHLTSITRALYSTHPCPSPPAPAILVYRPFHLLSLIDELLCCAAAPSTSIIPSIFCRPERRATSPDPGASLPCAPFIPSTDTFVASHLKPRSKKKPHASRVSFAFSSLLLLLLFFFFLFSSRQYS